MPGPPSTLDARAIQPLLQRWARAVVRPDARVEAVRPMPGNSGLSFGFTAVGDAGGEESFVVRLAPPGVRRRGNTDVLRQVPLLRALHEHAVPIAPVRWWTDDPEWFGTDALVQEYVPALPLHMTDASLGVRVPEAEVPVLLDRAVDTLVAIHRVPVESLSGWEAPRSIDTELAFWDDVLRSADDADWLAAGRDLRAHLADAAPAGPRTGLFHGDYQTNNVLFDERAQVAAVVDWEIAGLGPQWLDLGWLMMMCDPACWHPSYRGRMRVVARPRDLLRRYEATSGARVDQPRWYQALACYRFGAIAAFNYRLHRTGRRVDELYAAMAPSVGALFERGVHLLREPDGQVD
ncbi:phosphotransferase family protein [Blastococcus mobilis]|uniref:Predicted kinase, aminoglycoside phosphotransferase (APT) family n=1 Tax=Blastococcus mobilis TaxID=1938746 RepID=A0A238X487_9ACTN|nr:phosphotransferase family protein [Blastococcus mobilis]SNR53403.1 Predicted kinase, aminoglycoside phosphotransferase (APT) family [Blastococcus mobilis]